MAQVSAMAHLDGESDENVDGDLVLTLPYKRPKYDDFFTFWTFTTESTRAMPVLQRLDAVEAVSGIMSGALVDSMDAMKYCLPVIEPASFSCLGEDIVSALEAHIASQAQSPLQGAKQLVCIEPKLAATNSVGNAAASLRYSIPARYHSRYHVPNTLPGWSVAIYFSSRIQSWPGIVELYTIPPSSSYIPLLPRNSIRFKFSIPTGGKKDFDALTDVAAAHYSLRLQCIRDLQSQWPRLGSISVDEPGIDYVLNSLIVPEIIFIVSLAPDVLDREQFVDFCFRGFEGAETMAWAKEVKVLVSHHIMFHFRGRKLLFVNSN